jgi:hypothetical protein
VRRGHSLRSGGRGQCWVVCAAGAHHQGAAEAEVSHLVREAKSDRPMLVSRLSPMSVPLLALGRGMLSQKAVISSFSVLSLTYGAPTASIAQ